MSALVPTSRLAVIAVHEAGHAVAARLLQVPMKFVTIVRSGDALGTMQHRSLQFIRQGTFDDSPRGVDRAERYILASFAGRLAQRRFAPRSHWRIAGAHDLVGELEVFARIAGPDEKARNLYMALLWRRSECFVESARNWKVITAVAEELLRHGTLNADQVWKVIETSMRLPPVKIKPPTGDGQLIAQAQ